ncbi:hypothetical protein N8630_02980, partial [Synechococcus sp. AH-601-C19]|nr:hypothetical protein [Synechococcus sp. AH-601-C19]
NSTSNAGDVKLTNNATINTFGVSTAAIIAQSIGGGGGASATSAGDSIRLGAISTATDSATLPIIKSGNVSVTNTQNLSTNALGSVGLLAQSIAGGGGYISETQGNSNYTIIFGADGEFNATAGSVDVINNADFVATQGDNSPAIVAQSIGGGGGYALLTASGDGITRIGDKNNDLGSSNSGNVTVNNNSILSTKGNNSTALTVQTIGGGGGVIASAAGNLALGTETHQGAAFAGSVDVVNTAPITTDGNYSSAIVIQNIGSGGGFVAGAGGGSAKLGAINGISTTEGSSGDVSLISTGSLVSTKGKGATAILVQSVGGGGGFVGSSEDGVTLGGTSLENISAGNITVRNTSIIRTTGNASAGLVAQSIGGGGGVVSTTSNEKIKLGGNSLTNAVAGDLIVTNRAQISTAGNTSPVLMVQSIGGGGGFTTLDEIVTSEKNTNTIRLGDKLSTSSKAGSIQLTNTGNLFSAGRSSSALVVQSIGGGGGNIRRINVSDIDSNMMLGSINNENGASGDIDVANTGSIIQTIGDYARPILIQSIGAGGGWLAGSTTSNVSTTMGAINPSGTGSSGNITARNTADISSEGLSAGGVFIQTIGGGGGLIGMKTGQIQMGLRDGVGIANSGSVDFTNTGNIITKGNDSPALLLQSIAGGGGRADQYYGNAHLGLSGNNGPLTAKSGNITLDNKGNSISTQGYSSPGITVQTIAGGGGFLGEQLTSTDSTGDDLIGNFGAGDYISDGNGEIKNDVKNDVLDSGDINITNESIISTKGNISPGLLAQSVGGGGGYAGGMNAPILNIGTTGSVSTNSGNVSIENFANITTEGYGSGALLVQSIAGGGGIVSSESINEMQMGAMHITSATSGNVSLINTGDLLTTGKGSIAILAQAVGGGGGVNAYSKVETTVSDDNAGSAYRLFLSGESAENSGAGDITVDNKGDIVSTLGDGAPAILTQSVGGGGGWAALESATNSNLRLGSKRGSEGSGGDISFANTADISTGGIYSQAIRVQSVGGGGGAVSAKANAVRMGSVSMSGDSSGGDITFKNSGSIYTKGDGSTGISIMSQGGGGGSIFGVSTAVAKFGTLTNAKDLNINASGGDITAENTGEFITTEGEAASAFTVVSGGGGGGFIAGIGGDLLGGSNTNGNTTGGNVTLTNRANLTTRGDGSIGLNVASHGGGQAITGPISAGDQLISVGNIGGSDGSGGDVLVTNSGVIQTKGAAAPAMAQSIGGGGIYAPVASDPDFFWLGNASTNTDGNNAGSVTITTSGNILTEGIGSQALIAQSIGGGGGFLGDVAPNLTGNSAALLGSQGPQGFSKKDTSAAWNNEWKIIIDNNAAGNSNYFRILDNLDAVDALIIKNKNFGIGGGGNASSIDLTINAEKYSTTGNNSSVVLAQSIGDGGGWLLLDQGNNYSFLGGIQSNGGRGGAITVSSAADLTSLGINSPALVAQSIGGGGGATGDSQKFARVGTLNGRGDTSAADVTINQTGNVSTTGIYSSGVLAQSIGGGGGLVGIVSGAVSMGSLQSVASQTSTAGNVAVNISGTITTTGNNSPALVAQSIGGGGGWVAQADGQVDMGAFSTGASNNQAGSVKVTTNGDIGTSGLNSTGLLAQSIGGGGGFIGINTADNYRSVLGSTFSSGLGNASDLDLDINGDIQTTGNNSAALIAQSIAGGGGSGALDWSGDNDIDADPSTPVVLFGSVNAVTTNSGNVTVNNQSNLITSGLASPAVLIQSIAGGGGALQSLNDSSAGLIYFGAEYRAANDNASASAGSINFTSTNGSTIATSGERSAAAILQSLGGGGGWSLINSKADTRLGIKSSSINTTSETSAFSATGGAITANVAGTLQTTGNTSPGFIVQSIGGGGGFAGNVSGNATLGGLDLSGSNGIAGSSNVLMPEACQFGSCDVVAVEQAVLVDIQGDLITTGSTSPVMLVQAIGGGGGRLGTVTGNAQLGVSSSVGNSDGGAIRVVSNAGASLTSTGIDSAALVIQSIGGGGGTVNSIGGNATLGGSASGSLKAGAITLNGPFTALTQGINSPGVVMQSIGGGGGLAADVDGEQISFGTVSTANTSAADVTAISSNLQIATAGRNAPGLILQSIGGGGGVAYTSTASVDLGGAVIGNTSSGDISLTSKSNSRIQTTGISSPAVIAQTIGGGGGYVGGDGSGTGANVKLGGSGSQIGNSGAIDLFLSGGSTLITAGLQSQGVIAQSIAGGGGFTSQNGEAMLLGMTGGSGNAADVLITNQGSISTLGLHSEGIVAQSIGGGGGSAGASSTSLVMGATNASGNAGNVTLNNAGGTIQTTGDYSVGVVAQSVGAGGGRIGNAKGSLTLGGNSASGNAGNVTINNTGGTIATSGDYSPSYLMQSVGGGGGMVGLGNSDGSGTVILGGGINGTAGSGGTLTLVEGGGILQATGLFSPGVIHQSIGGGGGWIGSVPAGTVQLGGLSTGTSTSADLELTLPFEILTTGAASPGAVLQSIA